MSHYKGEELIQAYVDGTISLGRLAEMLQTDPISFRNFLRKHGIALQTQDIEGIEAAAKNE